MSVRVRFAPSPTGYVHIGSLRTALYDYLYAKQSGGSYIVRIEDTDRTRLVDDAIENLIHASEWAGIMHDEGPVLKDGKIEQVGDYGPYIQSERLSTYKKYIDKLIDEDKAYCCFCSRERLDELREENKKAGRFSGYDGHCRNLGKEEAKRRVEAGESHVVRLKMPKDRTIEFDDMVRGTVTMNTADSDDQVLLKNDGFPTYHMAVVVDDHLMGITHIIRGEEWLPSTPKHIVLFEALGFEVPKFAHLPNILNMEKKKLSKRHGDVAVRDFVRKGYLPEALINFIALIGWSPESGKEIMTLDEMVEDFSFERVSKSGGVFDVAKLNWINNEYIKNADDDRLTDLSMHYFVEEGFFAENEISDKRDWVKSIVSLTKEKVDYLSQLPGYAKVFIGDEVVVEEDAKEILELEHIKELFEVFSAKISELPELENAAVKGIFKEIQKEMGIKGKNLFMPVRVGITGEMHGSDLVESIKILGKDSIVKRLAYVAEKYL